MGEKWYVTHIYERENYLAKGPHGPNGEPTLCYQMMWEGQANYLRDYLNKLEEIAEKYKTACMGCAEDSHLKGYGDNKEFWEREAKKIVELLDQSDQQSQPGGE